MNYKIALFTFILFPIVVFSQIKGTVKDEKGNALSFVNVYIEGTYTGTTTNELGKFELFLKKDQTKGTLVFQSLGFKTQKITFDTPHQIFEVVMVEESYELAEVAITSKENPANAIIRNAIKNREKNSMIYKKFTADFYSRGIFKLKNMPKKIFGQEIGDLDGALDSTGTGIIYLSETVSKVAYDHPNQFSETIIASKVSGDHKGYSFNTADGANFDFYMTTLSLGGMKMISPIANNAFAYYKFKLESSFKDNNGFLINKIQLIPKRDNEPVFDGYLFIVEDTWQIYGVDLTTKGKRIANEFTKTLGITQNYTYNPTDKIWSKNSQIIDINAGAFGIDFFGKFNHVFSNYNFEKVFEKKDFTKQMINYEKESNKKTDDYWGNHRQVPLTDEEQNDYIRKDSIREVRTSEKYLDSLDKVNNKLKILDLVTGYTYNNSFEKWGWGYDGMLNFGNFNTVQGWIISSGFSFFKSKEEPNQKMRINTNLEYSFSEKKLRPTLSYYKRFNNINYKTLRVEGGWKTQQFNENNPILPITNSFSTLYFKDNFLKIYDKKFVTVKFSQDLITGLHLKTGLEFAARSPLRNTDFRSWTKKDKIYTSNNPLQPFNENSDAFEKHHLWVFNLSTHITFGQKYINRPDGRINVSTKNYPKFQLTYKKGLLGSKENFNFDYAEIHTNYHKKMSNKGDFGMSITAGKFLNAANIALADYKHFNGNQSYVSGIGENLDSFNLLPYYSHSTSKQFFELHAEHNFKGYIMNKIPLINKLRTQLVVGYHQLSLPEQKPFMEFTAGLSNVGFGKFRLFRVDYVRAYQGDFIKDGVVFGLAFIDAFERR